MPHLCLAHADREGILLRRWGSRMLRGKGWGDESKMRFHLFYLLISLFFCFGEVMGSIVGIQGDQMTLLACLQSLFFFVVRPFPSLSRSGRQNMPASPTLPSRTQVSRFKKWHIPHSVIPPPCLLSPQKLLLSSSHTALPATQIRASRNVSWFRLSPHEPGGRAEGTWEF